MRKKLMDFLRRKTISATPINETGMPSLTVGRLVHNGCKTVGDIMEHTRYEVAIMVEGSYRAMWPIDEYMAKHGLLYKKG